MIKKYEDVLEEQLIENIMEYFKHIVDKNVWSSNLGWDENLSLSSSITLTHTILDKFLQKNIKNQIEKKLKFSFDEKNLDFNVSIYVWGGGSYITWHNDSCWQHSGTIYLNKEWNNCAGGIFLYKDNKTNEIKGIEPVYNTMVVNYEDNEDSHNLHCVTCIAPGTIEKRITIQWRTDFIKKNSLRYQ